VVPLGIPDPLRIPGQSILSVSAKSPASPFLWAIVGRLTPEKRQDLALRAFGRVVRARPDTGLVVIGAGSEEESLRGLAGNLGIRDSVRFLGYRDDVSGCLRAVNALVQASDREGMPTVILEAMAHALPVVATSAGGTEEVVEDGVTGRVVARGDERSLAQAMLSVTEDQALALSMGQSGRAAFEVRYTFDRMMDGYVELVRDLKLAPT
jgi:glycosyltransferase involved in cell wall biosynthesis